MDAFKLLKTDHQKVSDLFKRIESGSGQAKAQLFAQLKNELDVHAHIEEAIFYPALENKEPSRDITLEAYEEHKVVKDLLAELAAGPLNEEWDAKLTVLKENVEHHVEEEEGELFSKARQVLSSNQINELGDQMQAEKARPGASADSGPRARNDGRASRASKSRTSKASKGNESPGMLSRLANLVGLGASEGERSGARKSTKSSKKSTKSGTKRGGSKKATKGGSKAGKKSGSKKSAGSKTRAAKKAGGKKSGGSKKGRGAGSKKSGRSR